MSSARRIVEGLGSLWGEATPMLPTHVRRVNLGDYKRVFTPLESKCDPRRHYLINDAGFDLAASWLSGSRPAVEDVFDAVIVKWRSRFRDVGDVDASLSTLESREIRNLASRLSTIVARYGKDFERFNILVPGVGRLENIEIDVLGKSFIGEVKSGNRAFRSIDFRHLILCCVALGADSGNKTLLLMNPRDGIIWRRNAAEFVEAVSLTPFAEFIGEFRYVLSDVGISA